MDDAVWAYTAAIAPSTGIHRLVLQAHPDAAVLLSYRMPTYTVGISRLFRGRVEARCVDLRLAAEPRPSGHH